MAVRFFLFINKPARYEKADSLYHGIHGGAGHFLPEGPEPVLLYKMVMQTLNIA